MTCSLQLESLRAALVANGVQTPREKPKSKLMIEKTPPPRTRRLSIENCSSSSSVLRAEKKGAKTPFTQTKSRRLSLEGPRYTNKTPEQNNGGGGSKVELNQPRQPPPRIPRLQQQKTPEPVVKSRKGMKNDEHDGSQSESFPTPLGLANNYNNSSTQGKGGSSHIRKSTRSIGKLINGSEKRYNLHYFHFLTYIYIYIHVY